LGLAAFALPVQNNAAECTGSAQNIERSHDRRGNDVADGPLAQVESNPAADERRVNRSIVIDDVIAQVEPGSVGSTPLRKSL
jgi:hypothetical protein